MLVALPYFLITGLFRGKYLASARQRFGFIPQRSAEPSCWIHCVSVGEFLAAKPLIRRIRAEYPQLPLYVSTTTITGQKLAQGVLPESSFFFPFDWACCIRRVFRRIRPELVLVLETEIWPNFLWECKAQRIPALLVNGRLSDRSFRRYLRLRSLLPRFRECLMQTKPDAERMEELGAESIRVMWNLKFDFHPPEMAPALRSLLQDWKGGFLLWVAGSTMPGEEEQLLKAFQELRSRYRLRLLVAPRHPERFDEVEQTVARAGVAVSRRSSDRPGDAEVMILDSIGELASCYEMADLALIGGTFRDYGGHNPIEPAYFSKPILAGPHNSNFRSIFEEFRKRDAILTSGDITRGAQLLMENPDLRTRMGKAAGELVQANAGATEAAMARIRTYLDGR